MFGLFGKRKKDVTKLFFETDMHSHLVPGIDDGSRSAERSVELVRRMQAWGLKRLLITPHVTEDTFENTPQTIADAYNSLTSALGEAGVELLTDHSAEYRIDNFFMQQLESGAVRPLPNNYLLVENSFIQEPWGLDNTLFQIKMKGYKLILAHPERYIYYHSNRRRYEQIHSSGTLFQINLLSLAGYYGKEEKRVAEYLIENGLVDFVGTDLHRSAHADVIDDYLGSRDYRRHRDALAGVIKNDTAFI